jgi:catechol 2,3-dioxygenase-like lactoylglutathione lyase family enzyme
MRTRTWAWALVLVGLGLTGLACKGDRRTLALEAARASAQHGDMAPAIPIFSVRDLRASQSYYRDVLGFKLDWEDGDPPDFGSISRGHATIFMCEGCQGHPGGWVMIFTPNVDKLHDELKGKSRRALIKMPPTDMPWKLREMHVSDPDGNVMRFASAIEH